MDIPKVTGLLSSRLPNEIEWDELLDLLSRICSELNTDDCQYGKLAAAVLNDLLLSKTHCTLDAYYTHMKKIYAYSDMFIGTLASLASDEEMREWWQEVPHKLFPYLGLRVMMKSYLLKDKKQRIIENPKQLMFRVACSIHSDPLKIKETFENMYLQREYIFGSPTLFNAGTKCGQMSSCFLLTMGDSIDGIYGTIHECAVISKNSGGIGLSLSSVRGSGASISGAGVSNGIIPICKVLNETAKHVDQGGKRKGSIAVYLEPWHPDILEFLEIRLNHGTEEMRARDLFTGLWIPNLFMSRVRADEQWPLFCPNKYPKLHQTYGAEFDALFLSLEKEGKYERIVQARDIWQKILTSQIETGTPYMLFKDTCNMMNNLKNVGHLTCSNLCTEILEPCPYNTHIAVCNLASINLKACIDTKPVWKGPTYTEHTANKYFNFNKLAKIVYRVVEDLNNILDKNNYPIEKMKYTNLSTRPLGIGVQGLADAFFKLGLCFDDPFAVSLNKEIFEFVYFHALEKSIELCKKRGPYRDYKGSDLYHGRLHFDYFQPIHLETKNILNWSKLRNDLSFYGCLNSLFIACMPTASTANLMGNFESFEPPNSNIYSKTLLAGEFTQINKYLVKRLSSAGLWDEEMKKKIIKERGSIQKILEIPAPIRRQFRTVWEYSQKDLVRLCIDRAPFVDQSQSMNIYMDEPTRSKLSSLHFYTWENKLKTGMYYLRTRAKKDINEVYEEVVCMSCT